MKNPKLTLTLLTLLVISLSVGLTLYLSIYNSSFNSLSKSEKDTAYALARKIYQEKKDKGVDFTNGPCLTNDLMTDWVADLVHKPRQVADDLPQNQCQAYLEGRAHHFVELDQSGNLVRIY